MHADPLAAYAYRWFGPFGSREAIDRGFHPFWQHLRRLGRKFGTVVSANTHLTDRLTAGGVAGVVTLPMGVDPGIFAPAHRDRHLRRELLARCALPDSASLLVGIGRHSAEKRWPMVIDACLAPGVEMPLGLVPGGANRTSVVGGKNGYDSVK